ncbi:hypothetical protein [Carboxydothermus pertinax]|uniref:Uncharacterized protein n=1 Tax=Carboxydothermus pertinax TaxID=870242 RepID=A0A1L8CUB7_9THEO|nr:hypothetical protein [Carboxydothermus pertinax]GAV22502.1 hypothetical protein cpu_10120 [Carboxydothermus pertinax]
MGNKVLKMLKEDNFSLPSSEKILLKSLSTLTREERKKYYQELVPILKKLKIDLKSFFKANPQQRERYLNALIEDILASNGNINILNLTIIKALGSLSFYHLLNSKAKERNIKLTLQTNNFTFIIWLFVFFLILIYILLNRR